jgi:hypothetical protein
MAKRHRVGSGKKHSVKRSIYRMSRIKTRLEKKDVPKDLVPLFNHLIHLAAHDHKLGNATAAGILLRKARRLAAFGRGEIKYL